MVEIEAVTADNWEALVGNAPGLVLVDFWGPQCRPCLAMKPHLPGVVGRFPGLRLYALDATKARRLCIRERVMGLPTLVLYRDGKEISRHAGNDANAETVGAWLGTVMRQPATS